jgi:serine protease Do
MMLRHPSLRYLLSIGGAGLLLVGALISTSLPKRPLTLPGERGAAGLSDLVTRVLPAVVNITAETGLGWAARPTPPRFCGSMSAAKAADTPVVRDGSGFIIDPGGYIMTNRHVVDGADQITVTLQDNTVLQATVVGVSPCDLALLKVNAEGPLPALTLADSDLVRVGDPVVAVGNALGLGSSVSVGIVSALHRNIRFGPFDNFIQTDAAINHGNSGGPLLNAKGEVIGVNSVALTSISGSIGLGFAFTSNDAKFVADQLRKNGWVRAGWLGLTVQPVTPEIAQALGLERASGAIVAAVNDRWRGAFQEGDVITMFDGKIVRDDRGFIHDVALTPIGRKTSVIVWREGAERTVPVTVLGWDAKQASAPVPMTDANPAQRMTARDFGLHLDVLSDPLRSKYNVDPASKGVIVTDIDPGSAAADSDLERGDVIAQVQWNPVQTVDDVRTRLTDLRGQNRPYALMLVHRQRDARWATLRLASDAP